MEYESDFSWLTNKHILDQNMNHKIVQVPSESFKGPIIKNIHNVDKNEEIDQLINAFKLRLSAIILNEDKK